MTPHAVALRLAGRLPTAGRMPRGVAAGTLGSAIVMVACWLASFVVLPVVTGSVLAGFLGAVFAFWMLIVFALPLLALGALIGLVLAGTDRVGSWLAGTMIGGALGEVALGWLLPHALGAASGDFVTLLASTPVAAGYGAVVGGLTGCLAGLGERARMPG